VPNRPWGTIRAARITSPTPEHLWGMATVTGPIDITLAGAVALAAAGDEAAFARLVGAHHDDMTRVCFVICGDLDVADEAVQAAWPIIWRKLGSLREPDRLRPWLVSIAANEARQLIRHRRRRTVVELAVTDRATFAVDPAGRIGDLDLTNALARLDPDDRALLALRYVAGFNSTELARATGRSPSGTRARLARLLDRLRTELSDD
jgi:RNA polymerase sigma factor (sigma-70 family)